MRPRRRSIDSSSSSSSSDSDDSRGKRLSKQEKKQRKERKKMEHNHSQAPLMPEPMHHDFASNMSQGPPSVTPGFSAPPASGYRIPLRTDAPFPGNQLGEPPCRDLDGSPIYFGSALFDNSVHPCKIGPHLNNYCSVPYAGTEVSHTGRYDLLPFDSNTMELVQTSHGHIPNGRRPVEGGYEDHGARLYHAVGLVNGVKVPGKTGSHLGGCNIPFGGAEHAITQNYEILQVFLLQVGHKLIIS